MATPDLSSYSPGDDVSASASASSPELAPEAWIARFESPLGTGTDGQLSGLRFAAKDNINVAGVATTAACAAFAYQPAAHAAVVEKLLNAGAQLLGKTNLDQFACGLNGTRSPWGAVPNAFNRLYVSGGSSAGSAYVVATGQVDFALGTDTAGSGRVPAGLNNIVGLKPSKGLISARGVVPAAQRVDCVSILARTVGLAADVLEQAMSFDPLDPFSRRLTLSRDAWGASFRFGVPDSLNFFGDTLAEAEFERAIDRLKAQGGRAVTINYQPLARAAALLYDSALVVERYLAIREFFDRHEAEVIEPVRSIIASGRRFSAADLAAAQVQLRELTRDAEAMWQDIDLLVVPTAPTHYTLAQMQADPIVLNRNLGAYTNFVNLLDYAALSVPSSIRSDGLPFGITLVGRCGSDWRLAELGQRFHHASGLTQGAFAQPLGEIRPIAGISRTATVRVAVVGAHLSGMPLNSQLTERRARLVAAAETAPSYQLYALADSKPPKPGLLRVADGAGARIALEIWELPAEQYGSFVALIPAPLGIGSLQLSDGSTVQGFVCEPQGLVGAQNISEYGGWRAYSASRPAT